MAIVPDIFRFSRLRFDDRLVRTIRSTPRQVMGRNSYFYVNGEGRHNTGTSLSDAGQYGNSKNVVWLALVLKGSLDRSRACLKLIAGSSLSSIVIGRCAMESASPPVHYPNLSLSLESAFDTACVPVAKTNASMRLSVDV